MSLTYLWTLIQLFVWILNICICMYVCVRVCIASRFLPLNFISQLASRSSWKFAWRWWSFLALQQRQTHQMVMIRVFVIFLPFVLISSHNASLWVGLGGVHQPLPVVILFWLQTTPSLHIAMLQISQPLPIALALHPEKEAENEVQKEESALEITSCWETHRLPTLQSNR